MIELEQIIKEELLGVNNPKIKVETLNEYLGSLKVKELHKMAIFPAFIDDDFLSFAEVERLKNKPKKNIIAYVTKNLDKILESYIKIIRTNEINQLKIIIKNNNKKIIFGDLPISIHFLLFLKKFFIAKVEYDNKDDSFRVFIPEEFITILNNCFENKELLKLNKLNNNVYNYVKNVINTYGVITIDKLYELFEKQMFRINEDKLRHIITICSVYEEENFYEYNGEIILYSSSFESDEDALAFYNSQKMNYKKYSKEDYKNIANFQYAEKLKSYKKFVNYLYRNYYDISDIFDYIKNFIIYDYLASAQLSIEEADNNFKANIIKILEVDNEEIEELLKLMKNIFNEYPKWIKRGNI